MANMKNNISSSISFDFYHNPSEGIEPVFIMKCYLWLTKIGTLLYNVKVDMLMLYEIYVVVFVDERAQHLYYIKKAYQLVLLQILQYKCIFFNDSYDALPNIACETWNYGQNFVKI